MKKKELYISVDIEATGPIPEVYSMYQLGACVVGNESENFFIELKLLNDNFVPEALSSCGVIIEELKDGGIEPADAMKSFAGWIKRVSCNFKPVFVAFNATFDWMFVHWYFHKFLNSNPFGISGLDIKAYYMGMTKCSWGETRKNKIDLQFLSPKQHTHNALDDAIEQAEIFKKMMSYNV